MRFLTDQDVYEATVQFLRDLGHDVVKASELGLSQAVDLDLLLSAQADDRVFVTRDRDFGGLVFVQLRGAGVIYLRLLPTTVDAVHVELSRALTLYDETVLRGAFLVIEPGRHRLRHPPAAPLP